MEGLFFVIEPIWWIVPISHSTWIISIVGGILLGSVLFYIKRKKKEETKKTPDLYIFQKTESSDPQYAEKTLREIRRYLSQEYNPTHSWAHIPEDIRSYVHDTDLLEIIETLETIEYTRKNSSIDEINEIQSKIIKKLS